MKHEINRVCGLCHRTSSELNRMKNGYLVAISRSQLFDIQTKERAMDILEIRGWFNYLDKLAKL